MSIRLSWNTKTTLSMIVCTTMLCIGCLMPTGQEKLSRQEQEAQEWIKESGGKIETIYTPWTGQIVGHIVDLSGSNIQDDELYLLMKLKPRLFSLDLSETRIDGSGMPKLTDIVNPEHRSISKLSLRRTMITDGMLGRFIKGADIGHLDLSDTCITDDGIEGLIAVRDIGILDLSGTQVTGAGIRRLKKIEYLREVRLQRLPMSDDDIPALIELAKKEHNLRILDLRNTDLSRSGIKRLCEILRSLHVVIEIIFEPANVKPAAR